MTNLEYQMLFDWYWTTYYDTDQDIQHGRWLVAQWLDRYRCHNLACTSKECGFH